MRLLAALLLLLQPIITVHTELVVVPVVVTDSHGHRVSGLDENSFHVYEDGRLRPTAIFRRGEAPITLGLIVDRSQSMRPKAAALLTAISAVLDTIRQEDELFGVDFNDRVWFELGDDQPFTHDPAAIRAPLTAARSEGRTALYDGVAAGLRQLRAGHGARRALLVISDGADNASRTTYADVLALARQSDGVIYAIGLLGVSGEDEEDAGALKRICRETGGVAYFPQTAEEIATASAQVAADLREQYTLAFVPGDRAGARAFRKIAVAVTATGRGRLRARTRSGYLAPPEGGKP
ncbi:MAG TPA: VWA domain-containing protein [Vicinamibacterales bacterium]|nr:VWA domain-containing protein [Vicinamibacterales bacterium]